MLHLPKPFLPRRIALACLAILLAVTPSWGVDPAPEQTAAPSDWRQKLGTFRIGIVGGNRALLATRRAQPFRAMMHQALGMPVELHVVADYPALVEAQMQSRVDYAVHSALSFAATSLLCKCVEPLVVARDEDGATEFRAVLLSRENGINSLEDAASNSVLVPGKSSFAGYGLPNFLIAGSENLPGLEGWNLKFADSAESAIAGFVDGKADGLFGWEPVLNGLEDSPKVSTRGSMARLKKSGIKVKKLWQSPPVPHGPHVVAKDLNPEAKQILTTVLTTLRQDNPQAYLAIETVNFGGFVPVREAGYVALQHYVQSRIIPVGRTLAAKLDPATDTRTK